VSSPEEARREALEAAERAGPPPVPGPHAAALERAIAPGRPSNEQLQEWAMLAVDPAGIRSTRRLGGPITFLKRGLLRFLRQYTLELESQQTRFNLAVLARLRELEDDRRR
jgi:hypothetical protein